MSQIAQHPATQRLPAGATLECHALPRRRIVTIGSSKSALLLLRNSTEVSAGFHSFVQDANDLDDAGPDDTIVDDVHRLLHGADAAIPTDMSQVKASYTWKKIFPIPGHRTFWIGCNVSHGSHQHRRVPTPALISPSFGARCEDLLVIRLRRAGEPKSRQRRRRDRVGMKRLT